MIYPRLYLPKGWTRLKPQKKAYSRWKGEFFWVKILSGSITVLESNVGPPMGNPMEIPIYALYSGYFVGYDFPRICREDNKYQGYTVRDDTPKCQLKNVKKSVRQFILSK